MHKAFFAAVAAFALAGPAQAVTITFEGHSNTQYDNTTITRSGFTIGNVAGDERHFHEIASGNFGIPSNGTGVLLNDRNTRIEVTEAGLATFTLGSVDVGSYGAIGMDIFGFLNNVQVGVINIASLGSGYTTVSGASLGNIDRLVFDGTGGNGGFALDNLTLNAAVAAVPEPSAWALLILGFGAIGAGMRRRKTSATLSFA